MANYKISYYVKEVRAYIDRMYKEGNDSNSKATAGENIVASALTNLFLPKKPSYAVAPKIDIQNIFNKMDISFSERLFMFIDSKHLKDSQVYTAANISKQVFHKIRTNKNYRPKKSTVLALAIGLKLNLRETEELLNYAGYSLVRNDKVDLAVRYFIEKGEYNIMIINEVLFEFDLPLLGSK